MVQKCALKIKIMANRINDAKSWSHSFVNIILIIIRDINAATGKCIFLRWNKNSNLMILIASDYSVNKVMFYYCLINFLMNVFCFLY